ncbi:hypothetical protein R3P38DRAFT_2861492 [Favolaschia claudopus]|uniref:F-box domain-containing protein n=1 Tax=Favolaschia claudopus TaxID=2862362 RepID=A0AAW0DJG3_9AGAR
MRVLAAPLRFLHHVRGPSLRTVKTMLQLKGSREAIRQDGRRIVPMELWEQIFLHVDEEALVALATLCRAFNECCTQLLLLQVGVIRTDIAKGELAGIPARILPALRRALFLPPITHISCSFAKADLPSRLGTLHALVSRSPGLKSLRINFPPFDDADPQFASRVLCAMLSKSAPTADLLMLYPGGCCHTWARKFHKDLSKLIGRDETNVAGLPHSRLHAHLAPLGSNVFYSNDISIPQPAEAQTHGWYRHISGGQTTYRPQPRGDPILGPMSLPIRLPKVTSISSATFQHLIELVDNTDPYVYDREGFTTILQKLSERDPNIPTALAIGDPSYHIQPFSEAELALTRSLHCIRTVKLRYSVEYACRYESADHSRLDHILEWLANFPALSRVAFADTEYVTGVSGNLLDHARSVVKQPGVEVWLQKMEFSATFERFGV